MGRFAAGARRLTASPVLVVAGIRAALGQAARLHPVPTHPDHPPLTLGLPAVDTRLVTLQGELEAVLPHVAVAAELPGERRLFHRLVAERPGISRVAARRQ
jgi:hypothetical protein